MNRYRERSSGAVVEAIQFEGSNQLFIGLKMKSWPDENGVQPRDMSWGYIETQAGRKHIHIGDWIVKDHRGDILLYRNGSFQMQFEPVQGEQGQEWVHIPEERIRQIAREEAERWWNERMGWLRTGALAHPGYEVK